MTRKSSDDAVPIVNQHFQIEHGLQIEETHEASDKVGVYHLFRYWYAWAYIEKVLKNCSNVWDLGCGAGFGAQIMAEQHPGVHVHGVDRDPNAITAGTEACVGITNTSFAEHDLDGHWFPYIKSKRDTPGLIVCYDLISFLKHRDIFLLCLNQAARNGRSHVLFSTSPPENKWFNTDPQWSEKQVEHSSRCLADLLGKFFENVSWFGQDDFPLGDYVRKTTEYTGYPVGDDIIVCSKPR